MTSMQGAKDTFSKQSAKVNNVFSAAAPVIDGKSSEYSAPSAELVSEHQSKLAEAQNKIQECAKHEDKLTKSQVHIGTQDYLFFFMNNAKIFTQIQEIIEKEGFDFDQLKPKIITITVNGFMYFGYSKWLHPKLPSSIIGDEKASATFKLVVHTSASIAVTSVLAFGGKIYDVAHDMLFEKSDNIDEKEKKGLDQEISNNLANSNTQGFKKSIAEFNELPYQTEGAAGTGNLYEVAKEIAPKDDNIKVDHEEL